MRKFTEDGNGIIVWGVQSVTGSITGEEALSRAP